MFLWCLGVWCLVLFTVSKLFENVPIITQEKMSLFVSFVLFALFHQAAAAEGQPERSEGWPEAVAA